MARNPKRPPGRAMTLGNMRKMDDHDGYVG
jgi:hypothetical protein